MPWLHVTRQFLAWWAGRSGMGTRCVQLQNHPKLFGRFGDPNLFFKRLSSPKCRNHVVGHVHGVHQKNPKHVLPKNVHTGAPAWKECHTTCNIAVPSSCEPTTRRNRLEHNTLCGQWQKPSGNDGVGHLGRNTVVGFSSGHERFGSIDRCYVPTVLSCVGGGLAAAASRAHTAGALSAQRRRRCDSV